MARKATDLLDVFRYDGGDDGPDGDDGESRRKSAKARKRTPKAAKPARRKFEGISLNRRQLLLASSSVGLLLILSFVLGLAAGRPGGQEGESLQRRTAEVCAIRARVPIVDPATQKEASVKRVAQGLIRDFRVRPQNLRVRRHGGELVIDIGPFSSREEARDWLRRSGLEMAHIHLEAPFRYAEYPVVEWDR